MDENKLDYTTSMNPVNHLSRNGTNLAISRLTPTLNAGASDLRLIIGNRRQPYATGISHTRGQAFCLSRLFSVSSIQKNYHFDTHRYVQRLEKEGLTRAQAEGVMNSMAEVIDESIKTMTKNMVTKSEHEKAVYTQKVDFGQLKTELQLMERNDLATLKAENDRLSADLEKLKQRLREEITRTQAGVRLDLNLEKGRLRDESNGQEIKIREAETRIETEIAALRTSIQTSKATTLQYLVTFVTGCSALLMAYLRFRY